MIMKLIVAFCLIATVASFKPPLSSILHSPTATLKLYADYKSQNDFHFDAKEDRMRLKLFRRNAEMVAAANSDPEDTAEYDLNFFSIMSEDEKKQWLGLNATGHLPNTDVPSPISSSQLKVPKQKLWVKEGAVTVIKNQGNCGSCWTFAAVGGLETRYQQKSGRLRNFSEQEYLDCVYEEEGSNGCHGGWPDRAYQYSAKHGGRLAATIDYPYMAKDGACRSRTVRNAAIAYKITGSVRVGSDEESNIVALAEGSLSMTLQVTNKFSQYRRGILRDTSCHGNINHGVTGVGYTERYVLLRNSWGSSWGDQGYIKLARNHHNCQLFKFSSFARLEATGESDVGESDTATDYDPREEPEPTPKPEPEPEPEPEPTPEPKCEDLHPHCADNMRYCSSSRNFREKYCRKSCGLCGEGKCAPGTIMCADGVCRHEHMC